MRFGEEAGYYIRVVSPKLGILNLWLPVQYQDEKQLISGDYILLVYIPHFICLRFFNITILLVNSASTFIGHEVLENSTSQLIVWQSVLVKPFPKHHPRPISSLPL